MAKSHLIKLLLKHYHYENQIPNYYFNDFHIMWM